MLVLAHPSHRTRNGPLGYCCAILIRARSIPNCAPHCGHHADTSVIAIAPHVAMQRRMRAVGRQPVLGVIAGAGT
jgi:hypothetical protein